MKIEIGDEIILKKYGKGKVVGTDVAGYGGPDLRYGVVLDVHPFSIPVAYFWVHEVEEVIQNESR